MEDIYDDSGTDEYVDGLVGGVILSKFLIDNSDSTYKGANFDDEGRQIDQTGAWKKLAPPTKGIQGCIATFVGISSAFIAIASIIMLIVCGFIHGFNL